MILSVFFTESMTFALFALASLWPRRSSPDFNALLKPKHGEQQEQHQDQKLGQEEGQQMELGQEKQQEHGEQEHDEQQVFEQKHERGMEQGQEQSKELEHEQEQGNRDERSAKERLCCGTNDGTQEQKPTQERVSEKKRSHEKGYGKRGEIVTNTTQKQDTSDYSGEGDEWCKRESRQYST